jgi:hypothetical protein
MSIAVILNTHENSPVFFDTLESILYYLTEDVLVVVDGLAWSKFENLEIPVRKLSGFSHGKPSAPYRNVALGLLRAWETWGESKKWYCYLEYDCLVGSSEIKNHLSQAEELGFWLLGNDLREEDKKLPFIESLLKETIAIKYFLGCCLFFNCQFLKKLAENNFFEKFLSFSNFQDMPIDLIDQSGKKHMVYDLSEFLYPSLAVHYGGKIQELACWRESEWTGNSVFYPMRFQPELNLNDPYMFSCVMHPLKDFANPLRHYHRGKRHGLSAISCQIRS